MFVFDDQMFDCDDQMFDCDDKMFDCDDQIFYCDDQIFDLLYLISFLICVTLWSGNIFGDA